MQLQNFSKGLGFTLAFFLLPFFSNSQTDPIAIQYLQNHLEQWDLSKEDISDLSQEQYTDKHNGVTHIYLNQRYRGIKIYSAITSVHVTKNGKAYCLGNKFIKDIKDKVNTTKPKISATKALKNVCSYLKLPTSRNLQPEKISNSEYLFKQPDFANNDINAQLMYVYNSKHELRLAWDMAIDTKNSSDYLSLRVDAITGKVIDQNNFTLYCNSQPNNFVKSNACRNHFTSQNAPTSIGSETYRVVKFPNESPIYGLPELVVNPADSVASPYGWHDVDGEDGAEFTITRGNNVNAYLDLKDQDSGGFQPDGGDSLVFDFPFDISDEPENMRDAALTNLFYANNYMHDFTYRYGFTEVAGNFQENNYGEVGGPNDGVVAQAQDGSKATPVKLNNANFATPTDGNRPRMQMFLWNQTNVLNVLEPEAVAGIYQTGSADFGPDIISDNLDITAEVAIYKDNRPNIHDGCQPPTNPEELNGKIVMIDRGSCFFETKTLYAEDAGAVAVIICNFSDELVGMTGGVTDDEPNIPTVSMGKSNCEKLKLQIDNGLKIRLNVPEGTGPRYFDASFDNGVMAHEYGHGISTRLTGGPGFSGGLGNPEQMGEGWSDFFALVTTYEDGDAGSDARGVGNYLNGEDIDGRGIRRYPYSTDMSINPLTYKDVASNTEIHALGEVWTSMLWDLYWAFVDEYGYSSDLSDKTAGNNMAIQLVMDGMKMQTSSPGFVDGRNAILLADEIDFNNEHNCLIWKVFARRGLGFEADQGLSSSAQDQTESFMHKPECVKELKITKTFNDEIKAGEEIEYTLHVINHMDSVATNVTLTDEIPDGCSYVEGSANETPIVDNGIISWELPNLAFGEEITIKYKVVTETTRKSITKYYEGFEGDPDVIENDWTSYGQGKTQDANSWELIEDAELAHSGDWYYFVLNTEKEHDEILSTLNEIQISGEHPYLSFAHNFDTESAADAGLVYISTDEGENWIDLGPYMKKNGYTGPVQYGTFVLPFLNGFSGKSDGYLNTYVDLSSFIGENVIFRWRFGSDDNFAKDGWALDDIFLSDLVRYQGEACVSSNESGKVCTMGDPFGTAVLPSQTVASKDISNQNNLNIEVYPNPATDNIIVKLPNNSKTTNIAIVSLDGKIVKTFSENNNTLISLNVESIPSGFYLVKVQTDFGAGTQKVVIK